jgi:hypothetical protein
MVKKDNRSLATHAERRLGELLRDMPKAKGGEQYKTTGNTSEPVVTTLADIGIDKRTSSSRKKRPDKCRGPF